MAARKLVNETALQMVKDQRHLDALLAIYPKNVFYYSGSPMARARLLLDYLPEDPGRPDVESVVVLGGTKNVLICAEEYAEVNRAEIWVDWVQTYQSRRQSPMEGIAQALRDVGLANGRIGIEATYLTVAYLEELRKLLPEAVLVQCDTEFEWIRALKTPEEIALLKQAADLLDRAMLEAFSSARVGDTEWEIHCRVLEAAERLGAEHCRGILHAGDNAEAAFSGAGQKRLAPGEIIRTDYAAFVDGYPSNLSRVAVVGEPTSLQQKIYANLISGHRRIREFMRPGVTGREVFEFSIKAYADLGYLTTYRTILGHSLGLGYHERPMLTAAETLKLETNMVFALEPKALVPYHIQDQVVVGEYDTYLQSDLFDTRELFVVGA